MSLGTQQPQVLLIVFAYTQYCLKHHCRAIARGRAHFQRTKQAVCTESERCSAARQPSHARHVTDQHQYCVYAISLADYRAHKKSTAQGSHAHLPTQLRRTSGARHSRDTPNPGPALVTPMRMTAMYRNPAFASALALVSALRPASAQEQPRVPKHSRFHERPPTSDDRSAGQPNRCRAGRNGRRHRHQHSIRGRRRLSKRTR